MSWYCGEVSVSPPVSLRGSGGFASVSWPIRTSLLTKHSFWKNAEGRKLAFLKEHATFNFLLKDLLFPSQYLNDLVSPWAF